jgi:hypothetical protein
VRESEQRAGPCLRELRALARLQVQVGDYDDEFAHGQYRSAP